MLQSAGRLRTSEVPLGSQAKGLAFLGHAGCGQPGVSALTLCCTWGREVRGREGVCGPEAGTGPADRSSTLEGRAAQLASLPLTPVTEHARAPSHPAFLPPCLSSSPELSWGPFPSWRPGAGPPARPTAHPPWAWEVGSGRSGAERL